MTLLEVRELLVSLRLREADELRESLRTWRLWAVLLAIFAVTSSLVAFGRLSHCVCDRRFFEPWF